MQHPTLQPSSVARRSEWHEIQPITYSLLRLPSIFEVKKKPENQEATFLLVQFSCCCDTGSY